MDRLLPFPGMEGLGAGRELFLDDRAEGSFAFGLNAAPRDDFLALLHQGERVTPPVGNQGGAVGNVNVTIHVDELHVRQDSDLEDLAAAIARDIQLAFLRRGD